MNLVDDLKTARAHVERGWCSFGPWDADGVCADVALWTVFRDKMATTGEFDSAGLDAAREHLDKFVPPGYATLMIYNDFGAAKQDILDLFDKALADIGGLA